MSEEVEEFDTAVVPLRWEGEAGSGPLQMLDQRELPLNEIWHDLHTAQDVADGIRDMVIRGAPAIGIAAAFGVAMGVRDIGDSFLVESPESEALFEALANTRPTAVNLFWALERMRGLLVELESSDVAPADRVQRLFAEAVQIMNDDRQTNLKMGEYGAALLPADANILTHCNTGGLATGGYGTALGVIRSAKAAGKLKHVWVDETRPYLQGARLTAWECLKDELPATLITDSMAAYFMQSGSVDAVIVGTDRVAANGDVANKIGTYGLAVLCKHHGIPFYVAAPISTIDFNTATGAEIEIEQRSPEEVTQVRGQVIAPLDVAVAHPAFDVTPAELVTGIITEAGVATAPYGKSLSEL